jgi:hypothetical protein
MLLAGIQTIPASRIGCELAARNHAGSQSFMDRRCYRPVVFS